MNTVGWFHSLALLSVISIGCKHQSMDSNSALKGQTRIVDRTKAIPGEFPTYAQILVNGKFNCGGTLINPNIVLTAAHCAHKYEAATLSVILGDYDLLEDEGEEEFKVSRKVTHPSYELTRMRQTKNDIALLFLDQPSKVTPSQLITDDTLWSKWKSTTFANDNEPGARNS